MKAMKISLTEFQRKIGVYEDQARQQPLHLTKNGRKDLVLLSANEYERLKRRDREVLSLEQLSEADRRAIGDARMSDEHRNLDAELK
jgi:prevent-host-death family protein